MLPVKLAFIDTETTGTFIESDRVIEIAIVRVENGQVVKTYTSLINPNIPIPTSIENFTGIDPIDVEFAPSFVKIEPKITDILRDCLFIAHNADFDYEFLKKEYKLIGLDFWASSLCTVKLSRKLFPQYSHHNLDRIIQRFDLTCENRHRALDDVLVLWNFYNKILEAFPQTKLGEVLTELIKIPSKKKLESTPLIQQLGLI